MLLEHLRVFSRDHSSEPVKPVAVNDVVRDALILTRAQLLSRGIAVSLDLAEDLAKVLGAPNRLEQVLLNLIFNARDTLEEKRGRMAEPDRTDWQMQVTIRTRQMGGEVVLEVEDNGDGIGVEDRKRLFEPFFTTKSPDRGTGLGLAISYAIVKDHGGEIACDSQVKEGTTFRVRLPAVR